MFKGTNPRDTASLIQQYESLRDLVLRYARDGKWPDRFVAYNLCPLVFGEGRSQTVEFRSHEATFDGEGIARWIETACGVLSTAHEMEVGELLNLVRECALDRKFTVVDLLRRFRLMEQAEYYDARGLYLHLRPAWAWVDSAAEDAVPLGGEDGEEETVEGRTVVKVVAKTLPWVRKNAPVVMFWVVDRLGAESDAAKEKWEPPCVCGAQDDEKEVIEVPRVHRMREKEDDSKGDCVCGAQDDEEATRYFPRPQTMAAMKPFRVMDRIRRGTGASNMSLEEPAVCGAEDVGNESLGF